MVRWALTVFYFLALNLNICCISSRVTLIFLVIPSSILSIVAAWAFLYIARPGKKVFATTLGGLVAYTSVYIGFWIGYDLLLGLNAWIPWQWRNLVVALAYAVSIAAALIAAVFIYTQVRRQELAIGQ